MKTTTTKIATLMLAATLASAQATKPAAPASQSPAGAKSTTSKPAMQAAKPAAQPAKPATQAAKPAKPTPEKPKEALAKTTSARGKRDPFVSPVVGRLTGGPQGPACVSGPRCLVIDQVAVKGVVKTPSGMIAVITNPANKAYYLRVNDALYDGFIVRIEGNSVTFKQNVIDALGKTTQREVTKRVG